LDAARLSLAVSRGRFDEAEAMALSLLNDYPGLREPERAAVAALVFIGRADLVQGLVAAQARQSPDGGGQEGLIGGTSRTIHAFALHEAGETERAAALFEESLAAARRAIDEGSEWPYLRKEIAAIHAFLGDGNEALVWLERAHDAGLRAAPYLGHDPLFGGLRDDPRFQAILDRMDEAVARERARADADGSIAAVEAMIDGASPREFLKR
jgi:tetratricopeptide (TPR) repeat protein